MNRCFKPLPVFNVQERTDTDDLASVTEDYEVNEKFMQEFERIFAAERDRILPSLPCTDTEVF